MTKNANNNPIDILGVKISPLKSNELNDIISDGIHSRKHFLMLNVNIYALNLAYDQPWLCKFFNNSKLVFADGAGVILAGRFLGYAIPERITYADWMWQLAEFCEKDQFSLFFLGAKAGIALKAAERLQVQFPNLRISGIQDGYFDKTLGSTENSAIIAKINAARPDILLVGFGMPLQEKWLMENWDLIDARIALTGGAVFDYISGTVRRAPRWMTDHGLEWLGRLIIEPRRLWRRYIIGNSLFFWRVLLQRFGVK